MAEVNAAYDLLRAGSFERTAEAGARGGAGARRPRAAAGGWLPPAVRRALGRELLEVLEDGEDVDYVTPTATWASARALLVVTDRRLLWLLDDVVTRRVDFVRFRPDRAHRPPPAPPAPPGGDPARRDGRRAAADVLRAAPADRRGDRPPRHPVARGVTTERFDRRGLAVLATGHLWADFLQGAVPRCCRS